MKLFFIFLMAFLKVSGFTLNDQNTTAYGMAYTDTIISPAADFVPCEGDFALCYYANCTARATASLWVN
jgi:hypothetical protein